VTYFGFGFVSRVKRVQRVQRSTRSLHYCKN